MSSYWTTVLTQTCIFSIMALGVNVIWGWAGDFDLAFYGYVALGAYMTLVLTIGEPTAPVQYIIGARLPYPLAVLLAIAAVLVVAAVVGAVALRNLREIYFAIVTLGAISVFYVIVQVYTPLFNSFNGIGGLENPMAGPLGLSYNGYREFFLGLCAAVLVAVALVLQRLSSSPFGRMLRAVRDDERAAAVYGRNVYWSKYRAYLIAAALAGLAGGLLAAFLGAFNPSAWAPIEILTLYAGVLVGGRGNVVGVIAGTFVVYIGFIELTRFLPSVASNPGFSPALREVLVGLLIVLMLRFRPQGLLPDPLRLDGPRPAGLARWGRLWGAGPAVGQALQADVVVPGTAVTSPAGGEDDATSNLGQG